MRGIKTIAVIFAAVPAMLMADFSYTETTKMTGGALTAMTRSLGVFSKSMRKLDDPVNSSVHVKGNRMAHINDTNAQLWDLDKETITSVDFEKKTYSTITFAQMKEVIEKAMQRANASMKEAKQKQAASPDAQADLKYRLEVKETGKVQMIQGLNAREVLLIMGMDAQDKKSGQQAGMDSISSIWVVSTVPGYEELTAFHERLAKKMAGTFAASSMGRQMETMMAMNPQMAEAARNMAKEAEKLNGVHIRQIVKFGVKLDPATASQVTDPSTQPQGPTAGEAAGKAAEGAAERQASGRIGNIGLPGGIRLGGLGRGRKKEEPPPPPPPQQAQGQAGQGVLMEMVTEMSAFSTNSVDGSKFEPPAGFKQVEHPMMRALKN
jgi:hypothetical protein